MGGVACRAAGARRHFAWCTVYVLGRHADRRGQVGARGGVPSGGLAPKHGRSTRRRLGPPDLI
jgi:hypothetical protein